MYSKKGESGAGFQVDGIRKLSALTDQGIYFAQEHLHTGAWDILPNDAIRRLEGPSSCANRSIVLQLSRGQIHVVDSPMQSPILLLSLH